MNYLVEQIVWDLDYNLDDWELGLPKHFTLEIPSNGQDGDRLSSKVELEKYITRYAFDKYGYEVFQFEFNPIITIS